MAVRKFLSLEFMFWLLVAAFGGYVFESAYLAFADDLGTTIILVLFGIIVLCVSYIGVHHELVSRMEPLEHHLGIAEKDLTNTSQHLADVGVRLENAEILLQYIGRFSAEKALALEASALNDLCIEGSSLQRKHQGTDMKVEPTDVSIAMNEEIQRKKEVVRSMQNAASQVWNGIPDKIADLATLIIRSSESSNSEDTGD